MGDEGLSQTGFGALWWTMDRRWGLDFVHLNWSALATADLGRFDAIVIPDGSAGAIGRALGGDAADRAVVAHHQGDAVEEERRGERDVPAGGVEQGGRHADRDVDAALGEGGIRVRLVRVGVDPHRGGRAWDGGDGDGAAQLVADRGQVAVDVGLAIQLELADQAAVDLTGGANPVQHAARPRGRREQDTRHQQREKPGQLFGQPPAVGVPGLVPGRGLKSAGGGSIGLPLT